MAFRRFIPFAMVLVVLVTALVSGQGKPALSHAAAGPFIGTWLFTMTEPEGGEGRGVARRVPVVGCATVTNHMEATVGCDAGPSFSGGSARR